MRIRTKMMLLISTMVFIITFPMAVLFLMKSQKVLLEKTLETCRLLAQNISNAAREELLLNKTYDNTRKFLKTLDKSKIQGLEDIYVIHAGGIYVADLRHSMLGKKINDKWKKKLYKLKKLSLKPYTAKNGVELYRFTNPIFIMTGKKEKLRAGTAIIIFRKSGIFAPLKEIQNSIFVLFFIIMLFSLSMTFLISKVLSNPIRKISYGLDTLAGGKYGFQVAMKQKGEWGKLAQNFNFMSLKLLKNAKKIKEQAAMENEMNIARSIQMNMLPENTNEAPYAFLGYMKTADQVGGDYYDFKKVTIAKKNYWWFIIGDVSGHGLPAGLVMLMSQTALHSTLDLEPGISPAGAYNNVNKILFSNIKRMGENKYMTASFFRADSEGNFILAGLHLEALLYRKKSGKLEVIPSSGMWLGMLDDVSSDINEFSFKMDTGDTLLLYTDGITETMNKDRKMFGSDRLIDTFTKAVERELDVIKEVILSRLYGFRGNQMQFDDISFALIRKEE